MKVAMIVGAYRGDIARNISHAREASIRLWKSGYAVFCPHMNTAFFDGICPDEVWLEGDREILKRCDTIYILNNWKDSNGTKEEISIAKKLGKEIIWED